MTATARALVRGLLQAPEDRGLERSILALGPAAVPYLIEIVADRATWEEDAPGEGLAPATAARLLGELRPADAVETLVGTIRDLGPASVLFGPVVFALRDIGAPALEPILALAHAAERDPLAFSDVEGVIGACVDVLDEVGKGDDRAFEFLCRAVRKQPAWAGALGSHGDPRALPVLHEVAAAYEINRDSPFANQAWIELYTAIEALGTPTDAEREKHAIVAAMRGRFSAGLS